MVYKGGWIRDLPDHRDFKLAQKAPGIKATGNARTDLRKTGWVTPVENQGDLGSCTANMGVGLLEYNEMARHNSYVDHSRRFLYRASRKLYFKVSDSSVIGDTGSTNRDTFKAMASFGVPPEWAWPYNIRDFDVEPSAFVYSLAQAFQGLYYVKAENLYEIKALLDNQFPVGIGFICFDSVDDVGPDGIIPIPGDNERPAGGHSVMVVGYDDSTEMIIIKNSWGTSWGEQGFGYLPYWYFDNDLCSDYWSLLESEFVEE